MKNSSSKRCRSSRYLVRIAIAAVALPVRSSGVCAELDSIATLPNALTAERHGSSINVFCALPSKSMRMPWPRWNMARVLSPYGVPAQRRQICNAARRMRRMQCNMVIRIVLTALLMSCKSVAPIHPDLQWHPAESCEQRCVKILGSEARSTMMDDRVTCGCYRREPPAIVLLQRQYTPPIAIELPYEGSL